jgi:hypothetical protein
MQSNLVKVLVVIEERNIYVKSKSFLYCPTMFLYVLSSCDVRGGFQMEAVLGSS